MGMTELHELDAMAQAYCAGRGRRELWQDHRMTRLVITDEHLRYIIKAGDIVATPARSS
jgi:hypothetical protein